jgi:hypothetical protein
MTTGVVCPMCISSSNLTGDNIASVAAIIMGTLANAADVTSDTDWSFSELNTARNFRSSVRTPAVRTRGRGPARPRR